MKFDILSALATAALIGSEVFVFAFGAAWLILSGFHFAAWRWPAAAIGVAAAMWSAIALFQLSERAAAADAAFMEIDEDRPID